MKRFFEVYILVDLGSERAVCLKHCENSERERAEKRICTHPNGGTCLFSDFVAGAVGIFWNNLQCLLCLCFVSVCLLSNGGGYFLQGISDGLKLAKT